MTCAACWTLARRTSPVGRRTSAPDTRCTSLTATVTATRAGEYGRMRTPMKNTHQFSILCGRLWTATDNSQRSQKPLDRKAHVGSTPTFGTNFEAKCVRILMPLFRLGRPWIATI